MQKAPNPEDGRLEEEDIMIFSRQCSVCFLALPGARLAREIAE